MSDLVVTYRPTHDLRFIRRVVQLSPFCSPSTAQIRILQQRFKGSDGSDRWIDVPEAEAAE